MLMARWYIGFTARRGELNATSEASKTIDADYAVGRSRLAEDGPIHVRRLIRDWL